MSRKDLLRCVGFRKNVPTPVVSTSLLPGGPHPTGSPGGERTGELNIQMHTLTQRLKSGAGPQLRVHTETGRRRGAGGARLGGGDWLSNGS